jgi:hypothetical protein
MCGKYFFGVARTINTLTNSAIRKFTAFTAHVAPLTTHIGTPILNPAPPSASNPVHILEPHSYKQAMSSPQASLWKAAMDAELESITTLNVFESLLLPPCTRAILVKCVYKIETGLSGEVTRYKARLVVCGFMQKNGVDVDETYAPISKYASLRFLVSHCCAERIEITHLDIRIAVLNAPLEEEVWCDPSLVYLPPLVKSGASGELCMV